MNYFITGIGTDVGKTVVAAILTEALEADYWKPIQAGDLENSDTIKVQKLISNSKTVFHKEAYRLTQPMSPHAAAKIDNIVIYFDKIVTPQTNNNLIIEGAGGLMVPLNNNQLISDLIKTLDIETILVSQNYLGSINHTLLSIETLKQKGIKIKGIIFNGDENKETEEYILNYTGVKFLGRINNHPTINKDVVLSYKEHFRNVLKETSPLEGRLRGVNNNFYNKNLKDLARENRQKMTKAESKIWNEILRNKQCLGFKFLRQRPISNYIVDFFAPELNLIIEIDGYSHHFEETYIKDIERENKLKELGFEIIRFNDDEVMNDFNNIIRVLELTIEKLKV
jgi:dethiobiotin synthetase